MNSSKCNNKQLEKSLCVLTYMYSELIYLHFGGSYTSFTQLEAEIHALEYKCASNTGSFSLLFFNTKNDLLLSDVFYSHLLNNWSSIDLKIVLERQFHYLSDEPIKMYQ